MSSHIETQAKELYEKANKIIEKFDGIVPQDFKNDFFSLVNKINLSLIEDKDNFYGYFLFHMSREIKFDISSPSSISFKGAKYIIYFNPAIFLRLSIKQMETTIKHEILHIVSLHLVRAKELNGRYKKLAVNMAMDIVVNQYLNYLPEYSTTLEWVNLNYSLKLKPYETFEYYVEKIQIELDLLEKNEDEEEIEKDDFQNIETEYDPEKTHDMWKYSNDIDENTLIEFTKKFISESQKGKIPDYLEGIISSIENRNGELPWNLYLKKLLGTVESNKKKTTTRRNRRQPNRLDLRGELRGHKPEIAVAIDISGSISNEEFKQAIKEVLNIVKNNNHEITIIECDNEIKRVYKVKSINDIKDRIAVGGGTKFTPVFEYANGKKFNLLIYFTDGKGEDRLKVIPIGYKILWVISGRGDKLSLHEPYGAVKKLSSVIVKNSELDISDIKTDGYSMNSQQPIL